MNALSFLLVREKLSEQDELIIASDSTDNRAQSFMAMNVKSEAVANMLFHSKRPMEKLENNSPSSFIV